MLKMPAQVSSKTVNYQGYDAKLQLITTTSKLTLVGFYILNDIEKINKHKIFA